MDCSRGIDQGRRHVRAAIGQDIRDHLAEDPQPFALELAAGRMGQQDRALREGAGKGLDATDQGPPVHPVIGKDDVVPAQPGAVVDPLQHGPQMGGVRLEDDEQCPIADPFRQCRHVVAEPHTQQHDPGVLFQIDLLDQLQRF